MPLLTLGIPVYNGMPHLPETVESILSQSYRDFEFLIIDDGSTDDTYAYLRTIKDSRLRVIRQENCGLSATLNRMLAESTAAWHLRQDADDLALPDRLQLVADAVTRAPDAGMFYSPARYLFRGKHRGHYRSTIASPEVLHAITRSGRLIAINHSSAVLNVEKTRALGGYRVDLSAAQDQDLWWRMALRHDIQLIPEPTIAYRLASTGLSSASLLRQAIEVLFAQYLLLSHLWNIPAARLEDVTPALARLVDMKLLAYRTHLRQSGLAFESKQFGKTLYESARAAWIAPGYLVERLKYETPGETRLDVNGINPLIFAANLKTIWPTGKTTTGN